VATIESLKEHLAAAYSATLDLQGLTFRPMFGGVLAYTDERPLASLSDVGLALKLGPADQSALLELPGARRLQYEPDAPPSKSYIVVPESMAQDPVALAPWVFRGVEFVRTLPRKKR